MRLKDLYKQIQLTFQKIGYIQIEYSDFSFSKIDGIFNDFKQTSPFYFQKDFFNNVGFGKYYKDNFDINNKICIKLVGGFNLKRYQNTLNNKFIHLSFFDRDNNKLFEKSLFLNNDDNALNNILSNIIEKEIFNKNYGDLGLILSDELASLDYIPTSNNNLFNVDFNKYIEKVDSLENIINEQIEARSNILQQNINHHSFLFDDINKGNTISLFFNLMLRGFNDFTIKKLYQENILLNKIVIVLNQYTISKINQKTINCTKLKQLSTFISNKKEIEFLLFVKNKIKSNEDIKNIDFNTLKYDYSEEYNNIINENIINDSFDNFDIIFENLNKYYRKILCNITFSTNKGLINEYKYFLNKIENNVILNNTFIKEHKRFLILLKTINNIDINIIINNDISKTKEDSLLLRGLGIIKKGHNLKIFKRFTLEGLMDGIILEYKEKILENNSYIDLIGININDYPSILAIKYIISKIGHSHKSSTYLFDYNRIIEFIKIIKWYYFNINKNEDIIFEYINRIYFNESSMYTKSNIHELALINRAYFKGKLSQKSLRKLDNFFLKSEAKFGIHDTYMDLKESGFHNVSKEIFEKIIDKVSNLQELLQIIKRIDNLYLQKNIISKFENFINIKKVDILLNNINKGNIDNILLLENEILSIENIIFNRIFSTKKSLMKYENEKKLLNFNDIKYIDIFSSTFNGDFDFYKKITSLSKNIKASLPQKKSIKYFKENKEIISGFDRIKKLLGEKSNKGLSNKPGLMYKYINDNYHELIISIKQNKNFNDRKIINDVLHKFEINKKELFDFTIKLENHNNSNYWCAGDYSKCCMGYKSKKQKTYIWDKGFHIINIYKNDKIIANSLIFISYINGKRSLIIDSFEINNNYSKDIQFFINEYIEYLKSLQNINFCKQIVISGYNLSFLKKTKYNKTIIIDSNKIKPIGINYFNIKNNGNLFNKFKSYCYSDFNEKKGILI